MLVIMGLQNVGAGFRPGGRGSFVSVKGPKTIDVPSGFIKSVGRKLWEGDPTRCDQTRPVDSKKRPTKGPDGRRRSAMKTPRRKEGFGIYL